jgi:hypothetical protein
VRNLGEGELAWTAESGAPWLDLSVTNGTAPAEVDVTLDPDALSEEGGTAQITFTAGVMSQVITVTVEFITPPYRVFLPLVHRESYQG